MTSATRLNMTGTWLSWDGDPRDLRPYVGKFKAFLEGGGIAIFEDMSYPPQIGWLRSLGPEYAIRPENAPKGKEGAFQKKADFFDAPRPGAGGAFWSYFAEWGEGYKVAATDWSGMPVMLVAREGTRIQLRNQSYAGFRIRPS